MLRIRKEQLQLFQDQARVVFEERVSANLQECFPDECNALGPQGLRETVRVAIERAESHGLETEYDVQRYCNVAFALGLDFDTQFAWAAELLADTELAAESRVSELCERAEDEP